MEKPTYYHLCADGADARNFVISVEDFKAALNLAGVCSFNSGVIVVCVSIEDSHPHFLLYGTEEKCLHFKRLYEQSYLHHVVASRGSLDGVELDMVMYEVCDVEYLMNAAAYIVVQPTKDGKRVMPYDYPWGSGSLYFRTGPYVPVWCFDNEGRIVEPLRIGDLTSRERRKILYSRMNVPEGWLVCNGVLLPSNYVDIKRFESIYRTHNCYRTFQSAGKKMDAVVQNRISEIKGVSLEDIEARELCRQKCKEMYGVKDVRVIKSGQRLEVARALRRGYNISYRQLATLVRLPQSEVEKYVR